MNSLAVVAIGSRIMMDDGIGIWVAEAIEDTLNKENVDVVVAETDYEYGFAAAKAYEYVIVLDATVTGNTPGQITVLPLSDAKVQTSCASQHDMSVIDMLVRDMNPPGSLIGIEAHEVGFGFGLSQTLQEKFEKICGDALAEILRLKEGLPVHDSLLFEKTYQTVRELCEDNAIKKVNEVKLVVSMDSYLDGPHMLGHFMERDNALFGGWTTVTIEKRDIEKLTAVVESIDGEKDE